MYTGVFHITEPGNAKNKITSQSKNVKVNYMIMGIYNQDPWYLKL